MKNLFRTLAVVTCSIILFGCTEDAAVSTTGGLYGVVTDASTHQPIYGASITLSPTNTSTTTGSDGGYVFQNIESQQYKLTASASGYEYNSRQVAVIAGNNVVSDITLNAESFVGEVSVSTTSLNFGSESTGLTFNVTNKGTAELTFELQNKDDWFSVVCNKYTLGIGESTTLTVLLDRDKLTKDESHDLIVSTSHDSATVRLNATYVAKVGELYVNQSTLDFGNTDTIKTFLVRNDGDEDLTFEFSGIESWFSATCSKYTLAPGDSTTVTVTIDRDLITSNKSENLTITSNGGSAYVTLNATYVAKYAELATVGSTSLNFGETSNVQYFTLKNNGTADLTFNLSGMENWCNVTYSKNTLAPGESVSVSVTIDRTKIAASTVDNVYVTSNGGNATIGLDVSVHIPAPELSVSVSTVDFGESYETKTFTLQNTGDATMIYSINESLNWLSTSYIGTVAAGGSSTVTLSIDRSAIFGQYSSDITISSDGGDKTITIKAYEPVDYGTVTSCDRDIDISVTGVSASGTTAYIDFKMTNNSSTTYEQFRVGDPFSDSMFSVDDKSNTYSYSNKDMSITVNGETISFYLGYSNYCYVQNTFLRNGASLTGTIKITGLDSTATKFNSIEVGTYAYTSGGNQIDEKYFTLNNVPIIRQ